jgi:hypothetical protein
MMIPLRAANLSTWMNRTIRHETSRHAQIDLFKCPMAKLQSTAHL